MSAADARGIVAARVSRGDRSAVCFTVVQQAVVTGFSVEDDRDGFFEFGEQLF